jgi:hypothetical protein
MITRPIVESLNKTIPPHPFTSGILWLIHETNRQVITKGRSHRAGCDYPPR